MQSAEPSSPRPARRRHRMTLPALLLCLLLCVPPPAVAQTPLPLVYTSGLAGGYAAGFNGPGTAASVASPPPASILGKCAPSDLSRAPVTSHAPRQFARAAAARRRRHAAATERRPHRPRPRGSSCRSRAQPAPRRRAARSISTQNYAPCGASSPILSGDSLPATGLLPTTGFPAGRATQPNPTYPNPTRAQRRRVRITAAAAAERLRCTVGPLPQVDRHVHACDFVAVL